jgi:hypothetical protein
VTKIRTAGVYDIPADQYHADCVEGGSLSSSGARKLLPPSCPALFKAWRDGQLVEEAEHFDVGRAAHALVLGVGDPIRVIDADDWRSKAAREQRDEARANGETPVLAGQWAEIEAMATKLREHPVAGGLLEASVGVAEQTLVWRDEASGVWCRALVDWLCRWVVDYKALRAVDPDSMSKAIANYGYNLQAAWYLDGVRALGLDVEPAFLFVAQMKTPPYLVATYQLSPDDIGRGQQLARKARDLYARCAERDEWPGYADHQVLSVSMPVWAQIQHDAAYQRGDLEPEGASL